MMFNKEVSREYTRVQCTLLTDICLYRVRQKVATNDRLLIKRQQFKIIL